MHLVPCFFADCLNIVVNLCSLPIFLLYVLTSPGGYCYVYIMMVLLSFFYHVQCFCVCYTIYVNFLWYLALFFFHESNNSTCVEDNDHVCQISRNNIKISGSKVQFPRKGVFIYLSWLDISDVILIFCYSMLVLAWFVCWDSVLSNRAVAWAIFHRELIGKEVHTHCGF